MYHYVLQHVFQCVSVLFVVLSGCYETDFSQSLCTVFMFELLVLSLL